MERGQHLFHAGLLGVPSTDRDALYHASLGRRAMQSAPRLFLDHTDRHPVPRVDLLELFDEILTDFQHDGLPFVGQELDLQRPILDIDLDHLFGDEIEPILLDPRTALADLNQFGCFVSHSHSPVPYVVGGTQPRLDSAPSAVSRTMSFSSSSSAPTARGARSSSKANTAACRTAPSRSLTPAISGGMARSSLSEPSATAACSRTAQSSSRRASRSAGTAPAPTCTTACRAASRITRSSSANRLMSRSMAAAPSCPRLATA